MKADSKLAKKIETGDFIITAECAPGATAAGATAEAALKFLDGKFVAVNLADNSHGVAISSVAAAVAAMKLGVEPVLQMVTRDRNRIGNTFEALFTLFRYFIKVFSSEILKIIFERRRFNSYSCCIFMSIMCREHNCSFI